MIALDTSAIVAIALDEEEAKSFDRAIAAGEAIVGAPTLLEAHLVLMERMPGFAGKFLELFTAVESVNAVPFTPEMYRTAANAFDLYGKGRGHPARLNFGDCLAYAVAKHHDIPLLFKGQDFQDRHPVGNSVTRTPEAFRRIVVKIGSALLVDQASGRLKTDWLSALVADLANLASGKRDILVVSSGAIALGRRVLGLPRGALKLEESQAAAAIGQIALARAWSEAFDGHQLTTGQILLTLGDTEERRRYLNARSTIGTLLRLGAIPVINENDTVATSEIRYGDNDRLGARVATMMGADLLILLSDIDGLYSAPPALDPKAELLPIVERITPEIEAMAGSAGSEWSRGGMQTKIEAGKIATAAGTAMVIASGKPLHPIRRISEGAACTWFLADANPVTARKTWISGHLETKGALVIDAGAIKALRAGKSLLPAGVRRVEGRFQRGDAVAIKGPKGEEIGRGLVAYDLADAERIAGRNSGEIEAILGYAGRAEMIHRDDMALRGE